jgi:hypothetical protein
LPEGNGNHLFPARRHSRRENDGKSPEDITGMLLVAEQYAAPYDLVGQAVAVPPAQVRSITAGWRGAAGAGGAGLDSQAGD